MSNNFMSSNYNASMMGHNGSAQQFYGSQKPMYFGDDKNLKKKRGMELLQTEEEEEEQDIGYTQNALSVAGLSNQTTP